MSENTTIGAPAADADGGGIEPDDDAVVTVFTHDGDDWVPMRLEPGENTVVRLANGQPAAIVEVDEDGTVSGEEGSPYDVTD